MRGAIRRCWRCYWYGAKEESRPFEEIDRLIEERRLDELEKRLRETGLMAQQGRQAGAREFLGVRRTPGIWS